MGRNQIKMCMTYSWSTTVMQNHHHCWNWQFDKDCVSWPTSITHDALLCCLIVLFLYYMHTLYISITSHETRTSSVLGILVTQCVFMSLQQTIVSFLLDSISINVIVSLVFYNTWLAMLVSSKICKIEQFLFFCCFCDGY